MTILLITLVLLIAVVASSFIARAATIAVPLPFIQIALGVLIAAVFNFEINLDPEFFLLLFIAPLLFLDGWRIPGEGLLRDKWTILALAFGLVAFTVLGAGLLIHWLIPAMPLYVAFALAAVLSPTDAVAVSAIAERSPIPARLRHILEGEALLNDAAGLVCLRFAVTAALSGSFSPGEAAGTFVWLAVGGIGCGLGVAVAVNTTKDWLSRRYGEEPGAQILISLLIPFGAYLLAVELEASGILAAAAAGVAMNYEERTGNALAVTRVRRAAVWDAVQFAGNGVIFVLLGDQLPGIVRGAGRAVADTGHQQGLWLLFYALAITGMLSLLRFLWVWATLQLILFRAARTGRSASAPSWRLIGVTSLAGVRGALTLSGIMTLPLALHDGVAFPARDLAIFLAAAVILISLVAANVGLPYLVKGIKLPRDNAHQRQEDEARLAAAEAAIQAVETELGRIGHNQPGAELKMQVGARIMMQYRQRIEVRSGSDSDADLSRKLDEIEKKLRLVALSAERKAIYQMSRSGGLSEELARRLIREIDLGEARWQ